jgi:hypothetical protein
MKISSRVEGSSRALACMGFGWRGEGDLRSNLPMEIRIRVRARLNRRVLSAVWKRALELEECGIRLSLHLKGWFGGRLSH